MDECSNKCLYEFRNYRKGIQTYFEIMIAIPSIKSNVRFQFVIPDTFGNNIYLQVKANSIDKILATT